MSGQSKLCHFAYLPHISPTEKLEIGDVIIEPLKKFKKNKLLDKEKVLGVDQMLISYKKNLLSRTGQLIPPEHISIVWIKDRLFQEPDSIEKEHLKTAINIFATCVLMENSSLQAASAENFNFIYAIFNPKNLVTGSRLERGSWNRLNSIVSSKTQYIETPPSYINCLEVGAGENELMKSLSSLLMLPNKSKTDFALLNSLDWYRLSYMNADDVNYSARLIFLGVAFEMLLQLPNEKISKEFRRRILQLVGYNQLSGDRSLVKWATSFYNSRSRLVHGGTIKDKYVDYKQSDHVNIGMKVYEQCLKSILEQRGLYSPPFLVDDMEHQKILGWIR